jgi:hypothetical protein
MLLVAGCSAKRAQKPAFYPEPASLAVRAPGAQTDPRKLIVTPASGAAGKVAMVNSADRFVVLNFPVGHLPTTNQHLNLYRRGLKVGEIKITGPQYDDNVVADIVAGDCELGDEARE